MTAPDDVAPPAAQRRIFCNRTLNLRAIRAVGFDMDYTLVHYKTEVWERRAWERARARLRERGWPVADLEFDANFVILGLTVDLQLGNLVKATRFGYVTRAVHGTRLLEFDEQRETYSRVAVDLREPRWVFLNTLFSLSEALLYAQCVDLLDQGKLPTGIGYGELYAIVRSAIDRTHAEGDLKAEIIKAPDDFVELDPELGQCLLDLKNAGKRLLLVTNSEWGYTCAMMRYALDPYLPGGTTWREVFDLTVVRARKPDFFTAHNPIFEVVDETGLLRPADEGVQQGRAYLGGNARLLEAHLGLSPEEILYVGDHLYSDVHVTKDLLRWRTALVVRDIEKEIVDVEAFRHKQAELSRLMADKEREEHVYSTLRLELERGGHQPADADAGLLKERMSKTKSRLSSLDAQIAPLAEEAGTLFNSRWGLLMRSGLDKSYLARQLERYADAYTSRVSNFLAYTPYVSLRAPRVSLPHDEA